MGTGDWGRRTRPLHLVTNPLRRWSPAAAGPRTHAAWSGDPGRPCPVPRARPHARQHDSADETLGVLQLLDGTDFDDPDAGGWKPGGDRARLVHVLSLDEEE